MSDPYDNWLADAVDAARACARDDAPSAREGAATRTRIHASLEARRGTSKRRLTLISAVIASLFGSTAFAYYSGWRPFAHRSAVDNAPVATSDNSAPSATTDRRNRIEAPTPEPTPTPNTERPTPTVTSAVPPTPPVSTPPSRSRVTTSPATTSSRERVTPPTPPIPDAELAAYQEAHAAHFRGTDAAAALAAWDRYLARFADGQLAPEARYDRAIVLVKLGRWADARAALTPFASAPAGAYRQREAAQILDAIRGR